MIALFLAPIYLLVNFYVYRRSVRWLGNFHWVLRHRAFQISYLVIYTFVSLSVVTSFLLPYSNFQRFLKALSNCWLGCFLYLLLFIAIADLIKILLQTAGRIPHRASANPRLFGISGSVVAVLAIGMSLYGMVHVADLKTTSYEVEVNKSCSSGDLTVALAADLHLGYNVGSRQVQRMVEQINAMQPDLVCLAGDIFDNEYEALDDPQAIIASLRSIQSRYGVFACYGNHDIDERLLAGFTFGNKADKSSDPRMDQLLKSAHVQLLQDESILIDDAFYLVGRRDAQKPGTWNGSRLSAKELTRQLDAKKPIFFIDHQPREFEEMAASGVDLDLSGHTHDGQIFPGNLTVNLTWQNPCGYLPVNGMHSVVTSGVGVWGPAMRVGTDSEVVRINVHFSA